MPAWTTAKGMPTTDADTGHLSSRVETSAA